MTRPHLAHALKLFAVFAAAWACLAGAPGTAAAAHVQATLVADETAVAPGGVVHVALRQVIEPGWHTYWRNPGDSGQATTLAWTLPTGWSAGDIIWAPPKKLPLPPLMDYGYEGGVLLPVSITAPKEAVVGQSVTLKARADYLVCQQVCVPEGADLAITLPVAATAAPDPTWAGPIKAALDAAPKPAGLTASVTPGSPLKLSITGPAVTGADVAGAYFFPYDSSDIDHAQPETIERGPQGLTLSLTPGVAFKGATPPAKMDGVLSVGGKVYEVNATPGPPLAGASGLGAPAPAVAPADMTAILIAIGSAFLGGLILNLMPCVFPILSMKAIALARHAHGRSAGLNGLAFLGGVVATFLALAGALIAARAAGQAVGWGFQLQSPAVVAGLALVMLLTALNLSGVFEVGQSLQAAAGEAGGADTGNLWGSALTGVLAVAVAAPCTAPFMAPAIGFALTQGPAIALAIFLSLGAGLAAPFTALAFAPVLLKLLPRPGAWMDTLKGVLAFPMYGAAAWLVWVFSQQAGTLGLAALMAAAVFAGFAAWLYGRAQSARIAGGAPWARFGLAGLSMIIALVLAFFPQGGAPSAAGTAAPGGIASVPFSTAKLDALRASGTPVLLDFTAAWCVTCQVNERVALDTPPVADAFRKTGAVYMVGDWTNRDAAIAQFLTANGRAGVPLYLVYGKGGGEPVTLPQILTPGIVVDAVNKAAG